LINRDNIATGKLLQRLSQVLFDDVLVHLMGHYEGSKGYAAEGADAEGACLEIAAAAEV
jgi:hypothetical protein